MFIIGGVLVSFFLVSHAYAADRFWVGSANGSDRFEDAANWSALPKGAGGASVPGASDVAIFSFSGSTVQIRSAVNVAGMELNDVWTGSVLQGTGTIAVGSSDFLVGSGRFIGGNATIAVTGDFTQTGGVVSGIQSTLTLSGSFSVTAGGVSTPSFTLTGTLVFDGAADQSLTLDAATSTTIQNLTLDNSGGGTSDDIVVTAPAGLNLSGALTITLGNLDLATNSETMDVEGGITLANAAQATLTTDSNVTASGTILVNDSAVLTVTAGTWTLNDDGDQDVDFDGQSLFNLTLNNTGGANNSDVTIDGTSLSLSGSLTITKGDLDLATNSQVLSVDSSVTLADDADAFLTTISNMTVGGGFTVGDAATLTVTGGTLTLDGTADQTLDLDGQPIFGLTLNNTGGGTSDDITVAGGTLQLSGSLTVTLGNLDLSTNSLAMIVEGGMTLANTAQATLTTDSNVSASGTILVNDSATLTVSGGTWTLNDDGNQSVDFDGQALNNFTVNLPTSGTDVVTITGTLDVDGNLAVTQGELTLSGNTLDLEGNLTIADDTDATLVASGAVTVAGNITKGDAGGTTLTGSTVTLDGTNQTLSGSVTYHNLTKTVTTPRTLSFAAGQTQRITNTLTLKFEGGGGGASNYLSLRSTLGGTQASIRPTGTRSLTFLDVQDNNNTASEITCASCRDSGNNDGWTFGGAAAAGTDSGAATDTGGGVGGGRGAGTGTPGSRYFFTGGTTLEGEERAAADEEAAVGGELISRRGMLQVTLDGRSLVFKDVPIGAWFTSFIQAIVGANIASGYKDANGNLTGEFGPANNVTYAEIAKMALQAAGVSVPRALPQNRFAVGEWSAKYIAAMENLGVSIFSDERLDVNKPAPRAAVVQILLETFGVALGDPAGDLYSDVSPQTLHAAAVEKATADGIVSGDDGTDTFRPGESVNRAETAKIVMNALAQYGG